MTWIVSIRSVRNAAVFFIFTSPTLSIIISTYMAAKCQCICIDSRRRKHMKKTKETKTKDDHILSREDRIRESQEFNLLSDVFLSVALDDAPACQHIIRILTGIEDLTVKEVRTQYVITKINSRTVRLDVLAEDSDGKLYQIEIQRQDTVDHPRRVRYYGALADSEFLAKGKEYYELPDRLQFYISETDIWKQGKTVYPVTKRLGKDGPEYDDGEYIVYVNAEVDDGSRIAKLMKYFKKADPDDNSEGDLSKRVHFLKCEEGGMDIMCEVAERIEARGRQQGEKRKARVTAQNLYQMGMSPEKIAQAVGEDISMVRQWLAEIKQ